MSVLLSLDYDAGRDVASVATNVVPIQYIARLVITTVYPGRNF